MVDYFFIVLFYSYTYIIQNNSLNSNSKTNKKNSVSYYLTIETLSLQTIEPSFGSPTLIELITLLCEELTTAHPIVERQNEQTAIVTRKQTLLRSRKLKLNFFIVFSLTNLLLSIIQIYYTNK